VNPGKQEGRGAKKIKTSASFLLEVFCSQRRTQLRLMWVNPLRNINLRIFNGLTRFINHERTSTHAQGTDPHARTGTVIQVGRNDTYRIYIASQTVTDAHDVGWSQTVTDAHGVGANTGAGLHAPQLHELVTVHTGWCERLSRLP